MDDLSGVNQAVLTGYGLVKRFATTTALAGVDIEIGRTEALAIMGPSGSGKSTLLHCLAGIMRPDAGEVRLLGQRTDTMGERGRSTLRRTRFGFVFQFGQLLPELPAEENVALPLMLGGTSRGRAVREARAWFGPLGLAGMEGRRPGELSGGQAQRVAIARALVTRPAVIFADEPTGALDQTTGHETMRTLVEAAKHNGASLVVVTHDPQVARGCDRVIEVRDGLILTPGTAPAHPIGPPRAYGYPGSDSAYGYPPDGGPAYGHAMGGGAVHGPAAEGGMAEGPLAHTATADDPGLRPHDGMAYDLGEATDRAATRVMPGGLR